MIVDQNKKLNITVHFLLIGIHSMQGWKVTMALQGMKLPENEEQKDEKHVRNLMRKNPYVTGAE